MIPLALAPPLPSRAHTPLVFDIETSTLVDLKTYQDGVSNVAKCETSDTDSDNKNNINININLGKEGTDAASSKVVLTEASCCA